MSDSTALADVVNDPARLKRPRHAPMATAADRPTPDQIQADLVAKAIAHETALAESRRRADEQDAATRHARAERMVVDALLSQRATASAEAGVVTTARNAERVDAARRFLLEGSPASLRAGLRAAIERREATALAHRDAEAELARARAAIVAAQADGVAAARRLEGERDRAALAAVRTGTLAAEYPDLTAAEADHDRAAARLTVAARAERLLTARLAEAQAEALNACNTVETLAAALVAAEVGRFAEALVAAEARAARLRAGLTAAATIWLTGPGTAGPIQLPLTDGARRLIQTLPENATVAPDPHVGVALRAYYAALLADPEARLAAMPD